MFCEKVEQFVSVLEKQELEAPNGIVSPRLYMELFAGYLYQDDLTSARFLWKRIPQSIKNGNMELEKMYKVYQCLWNNDLTAFYKEIKYDWTKNVAEVMFELLEKMQLETVNLIGKAYSSISEANFMEMTNQSAETIRETCTGLEWKIDELPVKMIYPKRPAVGKETPASAEDQLAKLTDFVSFLEN